MIGKIIIFAFLVLLFAGLGISGTVSTVAKGYHNISANPVLHKIGSDVLNGTKSTLSEQLQGFKNNILENELK